VPDRRRFTPNPATAKVGPPSGLALAAASLIVCGLLAAGCGSSSKAKSTATTPAISKAQFLAEGNAICKQGERRLESTRRALEKQFGHREPTVAEVAAYVTSSFAPLIQGQISALRALGAPAGEQAKVANLLNVAQTDLERVKSNPGALVKEQHPFANFARSAHAYGLKECAAKA
jgi:hypothetical protein